METVFIAGGALLAPLFVAIAAIGLLGTSATIEIGALATQTVRMRSLPAAWDARRQKRYSVKTASTGRAKRSSWWRSWLRFLRAPAIAYWTWWLALAAAGIAITVVAVPGLNYLLFEHCLRLALRGVERSHGMVVTYQSADGNLLKGCANLRGARLQRHGNAASNFDVTVARLDVDCDARKLISGQFAF